MLNRQFTGVDSLLCGRPDRLLLSSGQVGDALLAGNVQRLADGLSRAGIRRIASRLDNGLEWMTLDLAVQAVGGVHVPIPTFFSEQQTRHALADSGAQGVISTMSWSGPPHGRKHCNAATGYRIGFVATAGVTRAGPAGRYGLRDLYVGQYRATERGLPVRIHVMGGGRFIGGCRGNHTTTPTSLPDALVDIAGERRRAIRHFAV